MAGAASVVAASAMPPSEAMRLDLQNLITALNAPSPDVVFVVSPSHALYASTVLPPSFAYAIAASTAEASGTVIAVDPAGIAASLEAEPKILLTRNPAVHEDDAPLPLAVGGVVASPMRSLFQTDCLGMRITMHTGWTARSGAVAKVDGVQW